MTRFTYRDSCLVQRESGRLRPPRRTGAPINSPASAPAAPIIDLVDAKLVRVITNNDAGTGVLIIKDRSVLCDL